MTNGELIAHLQTLPHDAHVDAMFPDDNNAYAVIGVDLIELNGDRKIVVIDITDNYKPGAVA